MMMMYLLGLGSPTHPLKPQAWDAWKRTTFEYDGIRYIGSFAPLFIHQYSQAWFDFRGRHDRYADYFQNSVTATEVHRRFCVEMSKEFADYGDDLQSLPGHGAGRGSQCDDADISEQPPPPISRLQDAPAGTRGT